MSLDGQVAVVTGGSSGIGAATAKLLAKNGVKVAILARDKAELEEVVQEITNNGGVAEAVVGDISKPETLESAYQDIADHWGRIDMVFANAGVNGVWAPIEELDIDEWKNTIDINLNGTFYTIKYAIPHLERFSGGSIVVTASVNGTRMFSNSGATAYATTKAAQTAMAKMLALELAPKNVRINIVCPGAIETSIEDNTDRQMIEKAQYPVNFPKGKVPLTHGEPGTSEDVAELVLFLLSDKAKHITGTEVWIDGAQSLFQG